MAEQKRKPGRPKKSVGLKPPTSAKAAVNPFEMGIAAAQTHTSGEDQRVGKPKQVADGLDVQALRTTDDRQGIPVLPPAQPVRVEQAQEVRVFPTAPTDSAAGGETNGQQILDLSRRLDLDPELRLSDLLRKLLKEVAAPGFQYANSRMTNAEVLARQLLNRALEGNAGAQEMVIDRVEGKAVRANPVQSTDTTIDDQLDALDKQNLNDLVEP
jgi:hypothetical protein